MTQGLSTLEGFGQLEVLSSKTGAGSSTQAVMSASKEEFRTKGRQIDDERICSPDDHVSLASIKKTVKTRAVPAAVPGTVPSSQWAH